MFWGNSRDILKSFRRSYTPCRIFYEVKNKFLFSWKVIQRNDQKYWSVLEKFCKMYKELFLNFEVLSELWKNVKEICCKQWRIFWENSWHIFNSFERKNSKKISEILVGKTLIYDLILFKPQQWVQKNYYFNESFIKIF